MTWVTALLPLRDGVAVHAALLRAAHQPVGTDDRTRSQVMADPGERDRAWVRRLYTTPDGATLTAMDARQRLSPAGLAHFLRVRD